MEYLINDRELKVIEDNRSYHIESMRCKCSPVGRKSPEGVLIIHTKKAEDKIRIFADLRTQ